MGVLLPSHPTEPVGSRSTSRNKVFSGSTAGGGRPSMFAGLVAPLVGERLQVSGASPVLRGEAGREPS